MMRKGKENKDPKKPLQQFFKYVQPTQLNHQHSNSSNSKIHTRSLIDLDQNGRYQLTNRANQPLKDQHYASLSGNIEPN